MDTLTHALVGSLICDSLPFTKRFGPKAPLVAAIAGMAPDFDMAPAIIANFPPNSLSYHGLLNANMVNAFHRSYSHSFFYMTLAAIPLGWIAWRWGKKQGAWPLWSLMLALVFASHTILDLTNIWGVRAWLPFSDARSALSILPLTEPLILAASALAFLLNHALRSSYPEAVSPATLLPAWRQRTAIFMNRIAGPTSVGAVCLAVVVGRLGWALANADSLAGWF